MQKYSFGVVGLGVMGQNLALNVANHGFSVAGYDLDRAQAQAAAEKWAGKNMATLGSLEELTQALETPRKILIMVPAGKPVDAVLGDLKPLLAKGDVLIDGGNSFFMDTDRRARELAELGIHYIGSGVSGGEEGALLGPALMPGGPEDAYRLVEDILTSIAAKTEAGPCCAYIGKGGAGHYVKMVHNGIEYGIMQLICEAYDAMRTGLGMGAAEIQKVFAAWNRTELDSYLVEITAAVLARTDEETGKPMVDVILDTAGQKGTGKWTSQNALDLGVAIPTINAALEGRILSAIKEERVAAAKVLKVDTARFEGDRTAFLETLRKALYLATITCYAQGFSLMAQASKDYGYDLHFAEIARTWMGGCIIRSQLLRPIRAAFSENPSLVNLLLAPRFAALTMELAGELRAAAAQTLKMGVPALALGASLGYIDAYRDARMPANLLQAQRDYFGAHKYERIDQPRGRMFHTDWLE